MFLNLESTPWRRVGLNDVMTVVVHLSDCEWKEALDAGADVDIGSLGPRSLAATPQYHPSCVIQRTAVHNGCCQKRPGRVCRPAGCQRFENKLEVGVPLEADVNKGSADRRPSFDDRVLTVASGRQLSGLETRAWCDAGSRCTATRVRRINVLLVMCKEVKGALSARGNVRSVGGQKVARGSQRAPKSGYASIRKRLQEFGEVGGTPNFVWTRATRKPGYRNAG